MELLAGIRQRRSIRQFEDRPVPREVIEEIVGDAAYAPSWKNGQPVRYQYTTDRAIMDAIAENMVCGFTYNHDNLKKAPGLMVLSYVTGKSGYEKDGTFTTSKGNSFEMFDAGCAAEAFCLAAHARGVGTVITGIFEEEKILELLKLPENMKIGCLIYMGYPAESPEAPKRKSVDQLLSYL